MKKLIHIVGLMVLVLTSTGCATRTGTAIVAGTAGLIVGNAMAQPRHDTVIIRQSGPVVEHVVIINEHCARYPTNYERAACERGALQRYNDDKRQREQETAFRHADEKRRREQEAFNRGMGR